MKVYRYRKVDTFLIDEIKQSYLTCTSPLLLNDPFDCRLPMDISAPALRFDRKMQADIEKIFADDPEFRDQMLRKLVQDPRESIAAYFRDVIYRQIEGMRICCFSATKTNWPLWAHYANNHSGVCIEFEFGGPPEDALLPVQYYEELPQLIMPESMDDKEAGIARIKQLVRSKHQSWSYEQEWRSIFDYESLQDTSSKGRSKLPYAEKYLTGIYFGYRFNRDDSLSRDLMKAIAGRTVIPPLYLGIENPVGFGVSWSLQKKD